MPRLSSEAPRALPRGFLLVAAGLAVTFAGLLTVGMVPRLQRQTALAEAQSAAEAPPLVSVVHPRPGPAEVALGLPGEIKPLREALLYARTSGYLKHARVDIGDAVAAGALLAEIESPELDKEYGQAQANLNQARANLVQARANLAFARTSLQRWQALRHSDSVAPQDVDEKETSYRARQAGVDAAQASVDAARANVQRLEALRGYERVVAPFAGVITQRNVDVGALVSAGGGQTGSLFKLAQSDRLRIVLNVPQGLAPSIRVGMPAQVRVGEFPAPFQGKVSRSAGALDPASRTLLTEVQLDNPGHRLLPGMFARVTLQARPTAPALRVAGNTLVTRSEGTFVVVVTDQRVHFRKVELGRDDGREVEILGGLTPQDTLVVSPSDDLMEGARVRTTPARKMPVS